MEDGEGRSQFGRNRRRRKTQKTEEDKVRSEMPTPSKSLYLAGWISVEEGVHGEEGRR